jgi:hypothetical protein
MFGTSERETEMLNPADLQKWTAYEVANCADLDLYAVRAEGERRQDAAAKKLAKLQRQIAKAQAEMAEAHRIIEAALNEQRRVA